MAAKAFSGAVHDNQLFNIDYRIVTRNGATRYVNFVADKLIRDRAGNPDWVYGIIQDITTRKLTEAAPQDAKAQAELHPDLMSHDIINMSQIGIGFLEMSLGRLEGQSDETKGYLTKTLEALESSTRLIKNVGKLQRAGEGDLRITRVNVGEVIRELLSKYSTTAGSDIRINYRGNDCFVMANDLPTDVFSNIIGNAVKHSQGPLAIDIGVKKVREDSNDYCVVGVEDNGPGIPDSLKLRLFTRFQRGATKASGRGLGAAPRENAGRRLSWQSLGRRPCPGGLQTGHPIRGQAAIRRIAERAQWRLFKGSKHLIQGIRFALYQLMFSFM
jgi:signal transduction histidine kinase